MRRFLMMFVMLLMVSMMSVMVAVVAVMVVVVRHFPLIDIGVCIIFAFWVNRSE